VVRRKAHLIVAGCVSGRAGAVGALAPAAYDKRGSLTYCGAVHSGLHAKGGRTLYEQLRGLKPVTAPLLPYSPQCYRRASSLCQATTGRRGGVTEVLAAGLRQSAWRELAPRGADAASLSELR